MLQAQNIASYWTDFLKMSMHAIPGFWLLSFSLFLPQVSSPAALTYQAWPDISYVPESLRTCVPVIVLSLSFCQVHVPPSLLTRLQNFHRILGYYLV